MSQVVRHDTMHAPYAAIGTRRSWARPRLAHVVLLAPVVAMMGLATAARAEIIQIPAITFANRSSATVIGDSNFGTLTNATGTFYAPVPFPINGQRVCRFTLIHRDNDADFGITARLMKKRILLGQNPFTPPVEMAKVETGNAATTATVARLFDRSITQAIIDLSRAFYYVELTIPATTLEVLGVQIDVRSAC
jgi:hypothetical protein